MQINTSKKKKVVVVGGGTGSAVALSGLKTYKDIDLSAVVVVSDNGGSTGRLRDEFGFLPVGDLRQCIAALASGENEREVRQLLLYRFDQNSSLQGHNLGNLILTSLESMTGSASRAVAVASKIFRIEGRVLPISEDDSHLVIHYEDGQVLVGEKNLDDSKLGGNKISKLTLDKTAQIYQGASQAIQEANMVVFGPGDLYGSLLPNTLVEGFKEALQINQKHGGKFVYVINLMTHFSQTHQMSAAAHVAEVEKYCKRSIDVILINSTPISKDVLENYKDVQDFPIVDDLGQDPRVIREDLLSTTPIAFDKNDQVKRSVVRHNKQKLAESLKRILG